MSEAKACPRCGVNTLHPEQVMNCLSRRRSLYICRPCGSDEAARDWAKEPPLPAEDWGDVHHFEITRKY